MIRLFSIAFCLFFSIGFSAEAKAGVELKVLTASTAYGPIFYPNDGKESHPGVIVFHGSEGGGRAYNLLDAQRLASQGYVALAHCYYQCLDSMDDIADPKVEFIDINIDKPYEAFKWLKNSKFTKGFKTAVVGTSKGAELTFLIAALSAAEGLQTPDLIAAHAVTDVPELGFSWNWSSKKCWLGTKPEWNPACGTPPPFFGTPEYSATGSHTGCYATPPIPNDSYPYFSWIWKGSHERVKTHHRIPLEKFGGPIFFSHGGKDELWCVSKAESMKRQLEAAGKKPEVHIFPNEGHTFSSTADTKRWQLLLDFLDRNMK